MIYKKLGYSELPVSVLSFGTMTFGADTDETEAHAILDIAVERGVNLIDTAELYPVPAKPETAGRAEAYIGSWLRKRRGRDKVVIASKVVGPPEEGEATHIRPGHARLDYENIRVAIDGTLKRLGTDYVDVYQLHWPSRSTNYFERLNYSHRPHEDGVPIEETLEALDRIRAAGKIRFFGVCNETPWGILEYLRLARERGLPRPVSIQNPYNLLNRSFEIGLSEVAIRESVGLFAYSVLAFGLLSGKYFRPGAPQGKAMNEPYFDRYSRPRSIQAARSYVEIAQRYGLNPAHVAIQFVARQPFVTTTILGASRRAQLEENLAALDLDLPAELLAEIDATYMEYQCVAP